MTPTEGCAMTGEGTEAAAVRRLTEWTLRKHGNRKDRAADELGISLKTLYNRLNKWAEDDARRCRGNREVPMFVRDVTCECGGIRLTPDGVCLGCGSLPTLNPPPPPDPRPDPAWYDRDDAPDLGDRKGG
jgi:hypothetical protein